MAKMTWTNEQHDAIYAQDGTILVSAAAGSGKTAVLVQRAISRLTEGDNPVRADSMLIVTFTRAAAAEMRARLEKKLYEMIQADPKNSNLKRQSILLSQAKIGTIHSFCADILREFFHVLDIPPDFKIITDKQEEEMKSDIASDVLNLASEKGFYPLLADNFAGEREDQSLAKILIHLYAHMTSYPNPEKWLEEKIALYRGCNSAGNSPWGKVILDYSLETIIYAQNLMKKALSLTKQSGDPKLEKAYLEAFLSDLHTLGLLQKAAEERNWDKMCAMVLAFSMASCTAPRGYKDDPLTQKIKALREETKTTIQDGLGKLFSSDEEQCLSEFSAVGETLSALMQLMQDFTSLYSAKKLEKGFLDYADLEQYTLKLLQNEYGEKSEIAKQISERFAEIMIDEYQDMNEVQDSIFTYVSKEKSNLFMVGDVKQSIYGFRRAMPEIFMRSRDSFEKYDRDLKNYPSYIVLDRNFRSRLNVTESTNFVFSQLMNRRTAGMDYTHEEALVCGASYPPKSGCDTELVLLEKETGLQTEQLEGYFIACRICEMMESGFTVQENGNERPLRYSDFCILLRSVSGYAHGYATELQQLGIPAKAATAGGFFEAKEIGVILAFLRVIDNPNQDIPLLTVLMSPVYGFTPDDMLKLREVYPKIPLYTALLHLGRDDSQYQKVLSDIAEYRAASATMPSDEFIQFLYLKTGYTDMVLAMIDGENRLANLHLLQSHAKDYEAAGYNGISGFVRFLDKLNRNRSDMKSAEIAESHSNSVQIMSIHKSKGLEFPVCFVAGCGREKSNRPQDILFHQDLGLGISLADRTVGAKFTTMAKEAIAIDLARKESAEEMRILYVAMTRAKEKLILVGSLKKPTEVVQKLAAQIGEDGISSYSIQNAKSFAHWLILCALRHPDASYLRSQAEITDDIIVDDHRTPWNIRILSNLEKEETEIIETQTIAVPDMDLLAKLQSACDFVYPHLDLTMIPSKAAASAVASKEHEVRQGITLSRPSWLFEKGLTPAEKGIALHSYMQYANFALAAEQPEQELARLVEGKFLSTEQAAAVDLTKVADFFQSELGKRVVASPEVEKERRFAVEIPASEAGYVIENSHSHATVILQGALDCTFVENGMLHIVDFKTDHVKDIHELAVSYAVQLQLYKKAMEQISAYPIGECWIYSMYRSQAILVPIP
ncbi:helicase-exonuclease AddAB subunit AddA [Scatolibacter rhodanostii]|uniref:helicase-exonuclease AddAB subunit AddA n=1 Tax=Scatolibacter rhodanostii TaxID=2014781 RepID=UPI000C06FA4F|nr:helicase-exonuclease AddAB subunit AddA [Scatolibacter rhodanostii]